MFTLPQESVTVYFGGQTCWLFGEIRGRRTGGLWAELQREQARCQRQRQQALRMEAQAAARGRREHEQAARAAVRQAAADAKERKRLYIEERKAGAASMALELPACVAELLACRSSSRCHVTDLKGGKMVGFNPVAGAKWEAIIGRHGATHGLVERSIYAFELLSSHIEQHWPIAETSFASRGVAGSGTAARSVSGMKFAPG
jgi:hypothetical protein